MCRHHNTVPTVFFGVEMDRCLHCNYVIPKRPKAGQESVERKSAKDLLNAAGQHMSDRAVTYDKPEGERSMEKTVEIFNTLRGRDLTVTEGWLIMTILKLVRANQGDFKLDNYEDLVAYSALMGEAAQADKPTAPQH